MMNNLKNVQISRMNHVIHLWKMVLNENQFPKFDKWLAQEFAKNKKYGSQDRRWYSEVLFAGIRHAYFALFCEENFKLSTLDLTIGGAGLSNHINKMIEDFEGKYQTPESIFLALQKINPMHFFQWINLRYHFSKNKIENNNVWKIAENFIDENRLKFFNEISIIVEPECDLSLKLLFQSVPVYLSKYLEKRIQFSSWNASDVFEFLNKLETRPPLWLRVNHMNKINQILDELKKENYIFEQNNSSIQVQGAKGIFVLKSYQEGAFEIQDLASQKIGQCVNVLPKQIIWDCCAGGGGKTMQCASFLENKGVVVASDVRSYKLEEVKKRAKRAQFFNIRCVPWDGNALPQFQKEISNNKGFDWVLVDAPCSSSGTWRRNPDAKYFFKSENIENLFQLQLSILNKVSYAVREEGCLVYSTCSWLVEENENVVQEFLKNNTDFKLVSQNLFGSPFENSDTMFAAVMKKTKEIS